MYISVPERCILEAGPDAQRNRQHFHQTLPPLCSHPRRVASRPNPNRLLTTSTRAHITKNRLDTLHASSCLDTLASLYLHAARTMTAVAEYGGQARRHDLAAGGAKNKWRGQKPGGGHIFKILYWMYGATRGANVKWGGTDFKWGGRAPLAPPLATDDIIEHALEIVKQ